MKIRMPQWSVRRRHIGRIYASWRERYRKGALLRYYLNEPKDDPRSVLGKRLDMLGGLILFWLVCFILFFNLTGQPVKALSFSLPLLVPGALLMKRLVRSTEQKRGFRKKLWLAGQKITEEIKKMSSEEEFISYVRAVLAGLPDFKEALPKKRGKDKADLPSNSQRVDLRGFYKGVPLAVRCRLKKIDEKVIAGEIRDFAGALHLAGYRNGLYITSGVFHAGVLPVVRDAARKGIKIKLVNRYGLIELARTTGFDSFRAESAGTGRPGQAANGLPPGLPAFREAAFGSRKKVRNYFIYGLLLCLGYFFLKGSTVLSLVYLFFAVLNFLAGAYCLFCNRNVGGPDPLEGLEAEKPGT